MPLLRPAFSTARRTARRACTNAVRAGAVAGLIVVLAFPAAAQQTAEPVPLPPDSARFFLYDARLATLDTTRQVALAEPAPRLNYWRITAVAGLSAGAGLAVLETQRRRWWADRNPRFRILNDWDYVRWSDKAGHVYSSSIFTRFYRTSFRWAGLSERDAALWGAGAAWTQMFYYEVLDGFGPLWGFSPGDLAANTLGVGFTTAKEFVPALEPFSVKASYWPSGWEGKNFTDDYAGQTLWLTANLHGLAPDGALKEALPEWLNIAVGYGARDLDEREYLTTSTVYLALDIEPTILPFEGKVWDTIAGWLHYGHFPAPGIRLTPRPAFVLVAY
ncbi:MAG: DUF2279 domain-containing protein [Rhodothermales bacterium]